MNKSDKIWQAINTVFKFEVSRGHLKWKITDVARVSKLSRTLIYYYLGKTKKEIFKNCLERVADDFYGLSESRMELVRAGKYQTCVNMTQQMFQKNPEFIIFYFRWRMTKSPIQESLIEIERRYQKKLSGILPHLEKDQIVAFHAIVQGLVSAPFMTASIFNKTLVHVSASFLK
jgi:AcrR family transcriptional regulator